MRPLVLFLLLVPLIEAAAPPPPRKAAYDPLESYTEQKLRGWKLLVHRDLLEAKHATLRRQTLELLDDHLYRIVRVIPAGPLAKLREVPIWIELAHPRHPCMCYHVSKQWLKDNQMNPAKAGAVEIANVRNFLTWTHDQPWMVLHELAHAFHHRILSFEHAAIRVCYEEAMRNKRYTSVLHIRGENRKHYACTNPMEYFAEMTEAYFGCNDFYPFVRAELRQVDPRMYELLEKLWEIPVRVRK